MVDLALDPGTNDLLISNRDLSLVSGIDWVRQKLKIRLQFFLGEWYLDTTKGVAYYDEINVKNPNLGKISSIFKTTILETPNVKDLTSFSIDYLGNRQLQVIFSVNTDFGPLNMNEVLI